MTMNHKARPELLKRESAVRKQDTVRRLSGANGIRLRRPSFRGLSKRWAGRAVPSMT